MILGTGIDVMDPRRLRRAAERTGDRILRRLFTDAELDECRRRRDPWPSLAARFAAKEAFVKALGLGLRQGLRWRQVEVASDELGSPELVLHDRAAELARERGVAALHLSLSHQPGIAQALVILEGEGHG